MENKMFCWQCQETAGNKGCTQSGVCGKDPKTAGLIEIGRAVSFPNAREWSPEDDDWKLPPNWKEIILQGLANRLDRFRSLKIFMDCCVRCGACADKCHFFLGTGDPKNMPVLRAELLRSVYRGNFTLAGKILGKLAGGREMTVGVWSKTIKKSGSSGKGPIRQSRLRRERSESWGHHKRYKM